MKINLTNLNPGVFFPWADNSEDDEESGIVLRALTKEMLTQIDKQTTTKKKKWRGNNPYDDVTIKEERRDELMWDYCIVSWENLQDVNGEEISCTKENKILLMNKHFQFAMFVGDCLEQLQEFENKKAEDVEKN